MSVSPDLFEARSSAIAAYRRLSHPELGLLAGWKRFYMAFGRDGQQFIDCLSQPVNAFIPGILNDSEVFLDLQFKHQGEKINPLTEERPGKLFHQLANGFTPEDEFNKLVRSGFHVEIIDDERVIRYYGAVDATPGGIRAVAILARANGYAASEEKKDQSRDRIIEKYWSGVKAAYQHDLRYGDIDGDGLLESQPDRLDLLTNHTERDSGNSYTLEDGSQPEYPRAFLRPNALLYSARKEMAWMAGIAGEDNLQKEALEAAQLTRRRVIEGYWMPEHGYFSPLLYGPSKNQVAIFTDEAMDLLYFGVLDPRGDRELIEKTVGRFHEPDIMTPSWGPRSRSSNSTQFFLNGVLSYWNGNTWFMKIGKDVVALRNYGFAEGANRLEAVIPKVIKKFGGLVELFSRDENGEPVPYVEWDNQGNIIGTACNPQLFAAAGVIEATAYLEHLPRPRHTLNLAA